MNESRGMHKINVVFCYSNMKEVMLLSRDLLLLLIIGRTFNSDACCRRTARLRIHFVGHTEQSSFRFGS